MRAKASFAAGKEAYWRLHSADEQGRVDGPEIITFRRLVELLGRR